MPQLHEFKPDPDDPDWCTCGLPRKNGRHATAAATIPLPSATRNTVHTSLDATQNSILAAERALPKSGTIKAELLDTIMAVDPERGMTDKELERALPRIGANSLRPRRVDLVKDGWLEPVRTERGQVLRDGFTAWRLTAAGRRQWSEQVA